MAEFEENGKKKSLKVFSLIVFSLFLSLFLVGNVSAWEFDNIKNYDEETQTIDVRNSILGIPFLQLDRIAEVKLDTPLVNYVAQGEDRLVAEFTIENFEDYKEGAFDDLDFYDIQDSMKQFEREFVYRYKEFYNVEIDDYESICKERIINKVNGTYIEEYDCIEKQIGNHIEQKSNWIYFDEKEDLPKGNITIGIFTDVLPNERVEWIPTLFGVRIDEWAEWSGVITQSNSPSEESLGQRVGGSWTGMHITPNVNVSIISWTKYPSAAVTTGAITNTSGTEFVSAAFVGNTVTFATPYNLTAGTAYWFVGKAAGDYASYGIKEGDPSPFNTTYLNYTGEVINGGQYVPFVNHWIEIVQNITFRYSILTDETHPQFIDNTPTNQTIGYGDALEYNINATDETEFGCFEINDTINFKINCSGYLENNTLLSAGLYNLNVTINDSSNNMNSSFFWVNVTKGNPGTNMEITGTTPIEYGITSDFSESETNIGDGGCSYSMDRGNEVYGVDTWTFNYSTTGCTNYTAGSVTKDLVVNQNTSLVLGISGTTPIIYGTVTDVAGSDCPSQLSCNLDKGNIIYGVGIETFNYSTSGNDNYTANSITKDITITQAGDTFDVLLNGILSNLTVTFPQQVNVSVSNNDSTILIDVNGTTFTNAVNYTLGGGIWFVNVSTDGNQNYTSNESHWYITVNKATPTGTLSGTSPINYGTLGDVEGTESNNGDDDLVYRLYREGSLVSNPDDSTLGVGVWNYIYNSTGGQNYTSVASLDTFALTVDIATGDGTLLLNGSATNYTINRTENVNITATLDTGSGDISVYIDTTLFQTGSSPISDDEQFNTLGWYLINFTYLGNENYTGFEKYLYVNVTANPLAVVSIIYPTSGDYEAHFTQLNYTVLYGVNCWYDLGEGGGYVAITCGDNITGITSVDDSNTWTIKVENLDGFNTTDSVVFTIDLPIDYSTFTLRMVDVLKICIMLSGLFIIIMAAKSFFLGDSSFGRLFFICVVVGLAVLFILLLGPIAINYISTLIK